jgi:hypothetical protein
MKVLTIGSKGNKCIKYGMFEVMNEDQRKKIINKYVDQGCDDCVIIPQNIVNDIIKKWIMLNVVSTNQIN